MSINVDFYTFEKKINSTASPVSNYDRFPCDLKSPCTIQNPEIMLHLSGCPVNYNYAHIDTFNRFYFVSDWMFENGVWLAKLTVDVMASWKNEIGASSCYVLRSSVESNGALIDSTYPAKVTSSLQEQFLTQSPWITDSIDNGMFVVGVAGQSTTYYLFLRGGLDLFFQYLFSDLYASDLTNNWVDLFPSLKAQCNPLQYITSIMWIPFLTYGTEVSTIRVGWADVPVAAWKVDGSGIRNGIAGWVLRRHPQSDRGGYLNGAPFSSYSVFYPPWGVIHLDPQCICNSSVLTAEWNVDLRTGNGTLYILTGNDSSNLDNNTHLISWVHSQVGVPYQVSQVVSKPMGLGDIATPLLGVAASAITENYIGAAGIAAATIGNAVSSQIPSATTIGSNGGIDALRGIPKMMYEFKEVADEDNIHLGRPLCASRVIGTIPGYIKVLNAYIETTATQAEKEKIISFMEGGFYFE